MYFLNNIMQLISTMFHSNTQLDGNTEIVNVTYEQAIITTCTADNRGNAVQDCVSVSDEGEYSYAYQHPPQQSEGMDKGDNNYQNLGMGDYVNVYLKPSPLLVRDASRANASSVEEREDEQ